MSRPRKTARATIQTWLEALTWTTTPTVVVEPPEPDGLVERPTIALNMTVINRQRNGDPQVLAHSASGTVWDAGEITADAVLEVECLSETQAEAFEEDLRTGFFLACMAASNVGHEVLSLSATQYGQTMTVRLELGDASHIGPELDTETQRISLWRLTYPITISWDDLYFQPADVGTLNITGEEVEVLGDFDRGSFGDTLSEPFDMNDHPPAAAL